MSLKRKQQLHDEKTYLSEKYIQNFYQHLDFIEDTCKSLLTIKEKILPFELKKQKSGGKILGFDTMNLPSWAKNHFTEADAISLLNGKKVIAMRFIKLKEKIKTTFELGTQIATALSKSSISTSGEG